MASPEEVADRMRRAARAERDEARARAHALRAKLPLATRLLREAGATRAWVFGSMSGGAERFHASSDVDLAAYGLRSDRYFELLSALMDLFGRSVDLVMLEQAPASLVTRVLETGEPL